MRGIVVQRDLDRTNLLTANERILIDVLKAHGPVLERGPFLEHCRQRGMDEAVFDQLTKPSLLLQHNGAGLYAGAEARFSDSGQEAPSTPGDPAASIGHGFARRR